MGNITKSLWHLVSDASPDAAPAVGDRLPIAKQPGVSYVTQWRFVTVADLLALVPPASVTVDEGLSGNGLPATPINVNVDNVTIQVNGVTNELEVIGGAGAAGNSIYSTAIGSEPGSPNTGDADLYSNGPLMARFDGASWIPFGAVWRYTPPVFADFAWINQGTAQASTTNGGILLFKTGDGSLNFRILKKAAPSTPWFLVCAFMPNLKVSNFNRAGLVYRQSSDGKLIGVCMSYAGSWQNLRMNSPTSFAGVENHWVGTSAFYGYPVQWVQISDDGTNRKVWLSRDGFAWNLTYSELSGTFLTADEIGFFVDPNNGNFGVGIRVVHWATFAAFQGIEVSATP